MVITISITDNNNNLYTDNNNETKNDNNGSNNDMELDNCTIVQSNKIIIKIDIIMHPSYFIPCPYIHISNQSGSVLPIEVYTHMIQSYKSISTNSINSYSCSSRSVNEYAYILDEHPITGLPCYTIHICGLHTAINQLNALPPTHNTPQSESPSSQRSDLLIMLQWFSLVGPSIGLPMTDGTIFKKACDMIDTT